MIIRVLLEISLICMAAFDANHTKRKIQEYGISVELNPLIRFLGKWIGTSRGVDLGIHVPTGFWAVAGWYHPTALAFIVGTRFTLFLFQQRNTDSGRGL